VGAGVVSTYEDRVSVYEDRQVWLAALRRHVEARPLDMPALDGRTVLRLLDLLGEARDALQHTHSRLSLIRHRGNIRWDVDGELPAIGSAYECDRILGEASRVLGYGPGGDK
jgi:hypothetical protein